MDDLSLRVPVELFERIHAACNTHDLKSSEFCRKTAMQYESGKLENVEQLEKEICSTSIEKSIKVRNWPFKLKGKRMLAALTAELIKLESVPAKKEPKVNEIEGIDYNVSEVEYMMQLEEFDLPEHVLKDIAKHQ